MDTDKETAHASAIEKAPVDESRMQTDNQAEAKASVPEPAPVVVEVHDESADIMEEGDEDTVIY